VTVTPHILRAGIPQPSFGPPLPAIATPAPLPTLEPSATLPPLRSGSAATPAVGTPGTSAVSANGSTSTPVPPATRALLPTAFAQTNTFIYGAAPANNYADSNQTPQIFFVQAQPTVVKDGQSVTISAITTTNVATLSFGPTSVATQLSLSSIGPGKWQATFAFSAAGLQSSSGNVSELLSATTVSGASTSLRIPFTLVPR